MNHSRLAVALPLLAVLSFPALVRADDSADAVKKAEEAIAVFKRADPSITKFFEKSVGWAVFPSVAKGAIGIGGAGGKGVLFEKGGVRSAPPRSRRSPSASPSAARSSPRSSSSRTPSP